ncbi:MAG: NADAR family protein [Candidatus Heimdallarchaeaceae archaeon]
MQEFTINFFKEKYKKFSNFYPVIICYEDIEYPSVEHAYVASKSLDKMFRYKISQIPADKAGLAKREGRRVILRKNWNLLRNPFMRIFLVQKFTYPEFGDLLLSTGTAYIEEGNYWHDNYWGNCYCNKCKNIKGKNNLGKIIMEVRELIK